MNVIKQNTTDVQLVVAIKNAIKDKKPLSVVRCGDGEMHILKSLVDFPGEQQQLTHHHSLCLIQWRENVWRCTRHAPVNPNSLKPNTCSCYLKDPISGTWRELARELIRYAIKHSDYVGLTVPGRNANYYTITDTVLNRYAIDATELKTISSLFPREKLFGGIGSFRSIIQGNPIHIVSPNAERFKKGKLNELLGVHVTYTDISGKESYHVQVREKVKDDLIKTSAKIILFGGGYGIKSLIPWSAKELGKISIDVGSVLDAWSGLQSRHMFLEEKFKHLNWIKND